METATNDVTAGTFLKYDVYKEYICKVFRLMCKVFGYQKLRELGTTMPMRNTFILCQVLWYPDDANFENSLWYIVFTVGGFLW